MPRWSRVPLALAAPCLAQTIQACQRLWFAARQCQTSDPACAACAQGQNALARTTKGTYPDGLPSLRWVSTAVDGAPAREDADSLLSNSGLRSRDFYP